MMPSHVIADELGLGDGGVTTALLNNDGPTVERIAQVWNTTWNLTPDLDLKKFPSSGPYKLESVTEDGAVVLVANDKWWGAKPVTNKDHGVAARRRHPGPGQSGCLRRRRHRDGFVGHAEPARRLRAHRLARRRASSSSSSRRGDRWPPRPRAGRWRTVHPAGS